MLKRDFTEAAAPVRSPVFGMRPFAGGMLEAGLENMETLFGGSVAVLFADLSFEGRSLTVALSKRDPNPAEKLDEDTFLLVQFNDS